MPQAVAAQTEVTPDIAILQQDPPVAVVDMGLTPQSTEHEIDAAIRAAVSKGDLEMDEFRALKQLREAIGLPAGIFNRKLTRIRQDIKEMAAFIAADLDPAIGGAKLDGRALGDLERDFPLPSSGHGSKFLYRVVDDRPWLCGEIDDEGEKRLCTPFLITAGTIAVDRGNMRGVRANVLDEDGTVVPLDLSVTDMVSSYGAGAKIALRGAGVGMTEAGEKFLVSQFKQTAPAHPIVIYDQPGHRGPGVWITPFGSAIGTNRQVELSDSLDPANEKRGDLASWRAAIDAAYSSEILQWKLAPLLSFASVIVNICKQDSPWIAWTGSTTKGKTTAGKLTASVWGSPKPHEGIYGPLNGTEKAAQARLAQGSGAGNDRLDRNANLKRAAKWNGVYSITGEVDLLRKVKSAGANTTTGMGTRVMEINCEDTPTKPLELMKKIEAAFDNCGHAGEAFVRHMMDEGLDRDPTALWDQVELRAERLADEDASAAVRRAARIPGLLWYAGEIAQRAGLIPLDDEMVDGVTLESTMREAWVNAQESDLAPHSAEDLAVRTLFENLVRNLGVSVQAVGSSGDDTDPSYRKKDAWRFDAFGPYNEAAYLVLESTLANFAGGAMNTKAVAKLLLKRGHLITYPHTEGPRAWWASVAGLGKIKALAIRASAIEEEVAAPKPKTAAERSALTAKRRALAVKRDARANARKSPASMDG